MRYTQGHADKIHPREKRRLRRNIITWQGRLDRVIEMQEVVADDLDAKDYAFNTKAELEAKVKQLSDDIAHCNKKLAEAEAEMYAALEAGKRGEEVPFNGAKKLVSR